MDHDNDDENTDDFQGTQQVTPYRLNAGGYNIVLVDTPGFNDTYKSDTEILLELAKWLEVTYRQNARLNGIIYLHRITDVRMDGGAMRNLKMFRKLCGTDPMKNVIITSTFWSRIPESEAVAHEEELTKKPQFWGDMIDHGAQVKRFSGARQSALDILLSLSGKTTVTLTLQRELVDEAKPIADTQAGNAVNEELCALGRKYSDEIKQLQQETAEALAEKDDELHKILEKERQKMERKLDRIHSDQELLRKERREEIRRIEAESEVRYNNILRQYERRTDRQDMEAERRRAEERLLFREQISELHLQSATMNATFRENMAQLQMEQASLNAERMSHLQRPSAADHGVATESSGESDSDDGEGGEQAGAQRPSRRKKFLNIGGKVLGVAATGAMCAINPAAIPAVIGGVVDLINTIGSGGGVEGA